MESWATAEGATRLLADVREVDQAALVRAQRRGYQVEHHIFRSRLCLSDWNAAAFAPAVARAKAAGIRFTSFAAEIAGEESYERWRNNFRIDPHMDPAGWILAVDGERWVALSSVVRREDGGFFTGFTGVEREYRGRGLALATKVVALEYARSAGAREIFTSNHSVNAPMLAVNRKLGYVPEPGWFQLAKPV